MNEKICAFLIHLSENFWGDTAVSKLPKFEGWPAGRSFRDHILCEDATWDLVVSELPQMGINTLVIDLGDGVRYDSHPELALKNSWSKEKLAGKLAEARALGLTVIPKLNFSAGHDAWLKEYSRMLSTSPYYRVVEDLIDETAELFDRPQLFHLGMDEESYLCQATYDYCVVRHDDLWWSDLLRMAERCRSNGARPWIWADMFWSHPEDFRNRMPKDVVQSSWYYGGDFQRFKDGGSDAALAAIGQLDALGYDQIPCGSNWWWIHNLEQFSLFCKERIHPERFMGFMAAPWTFTTWHERYRLLDCAEKLGVAKTLLWSEAETPEV